MNRTQEPWPRVMFTATYGRSRSSDECNLWLNGRRVTNVLKVAFEFLPGSMDVTVELGVRVSAMNRHESVEFSGRLLAEQPPLGTYGKDDPMLVLVLQMPPDFGRLARVEDLS